MLARQDRENRPLLADALGDLGLRLLAVHRTEEVLEVSEEAIRLWHEIAIDDPETIPHLASALEQISYRYQTLGMPEASMDAISRATLMYQELAKTHPALFRADFARVAAIVPIALIRDACISSACACFSSSSDVFLAVMSRQKIASPWSDGWARSSSQAWRPSGQM